MVQHSGKHSHRQPLLSPEAHLRQLRSYGREEAKQVTEVTKKTAFWLNGQKFVIRPCSLDGSKN
jgi:hypothetical protein